MDEFDDLLQDSEPTGKNKKPAGGRGWGEIANTKLKNSVLDDIDDLDDNDNWPLANAKKKAPVPPLK